jgi:tetratricopeptide (TPR) repeat protein
MSGENPAPGKEKKLCFVIMGFGEKVDYQTGRRLNLDASYHNMIKPAVEEAGLECQRADEIVHSGYIDVPMYEKLLGADLVIADLSTYNVNAFYELGVRHALRPYSTIVIAEDKLTYPFDVNHVVIRRYKHLGEDIPYSEVIRFTKELGNAIRAIMENPSVDSPVYAYLNQLRPPALDASPDAAALPDAGLRGANGKAVAVTVPPEPDPESQKLAAVSNELVSLADRLEREVAQGRFAQAVTYFGEAVALLNANFGSTYIQPAPNVVQRLVRAASQVEGKERQQVLRQARQLLVRSFGKDSTDQHTLELLGNVEYGLFHENAQAAHLSRARQAYEKLYTIRPDHRSGSTLAYLISLQAETRKDAREALYDVIAAGQVRREVIELGKEKLAKIEERYRPGGLLMKDAGKSAAEKEAEAAGARLEVWEVIAEAFYGLGDREGYLTALDDASLLPGAEATLKAVEERVTRLDPFVRLQADLLSATEGLEVARPQLRKAAPPPRTRADDGATEARPLERADAPEADSVRDLVFFSYQHNARDTAVLEKIRGFLKPVFDDQKISLWHDKGGIKPGEKWEEEIRNALSKAKGAILLVSSDFLQSDFIMKKELPVILKGVEEEEITLLWVAVTQSFVASTPISKYQALNDPRTPLETFVGLERDNQIFSICMKIKETIFPHED